MKLVEATKSNTTRNGDIIELCSDFLKSGFEVAEVTEIEERYSNVSNAYVGIRTVVNVYFKGKIKATKCGQHIYLERLIK